MHGCCHIYTFIDDDRDSLNKLNSVPRILHNFYINKNGKDDLEISSFIHR